MRKIMRALLAIVVPAMLVTGVSAADAAPEAPLLLPAEVACTSFSNVWIGASYYMHVPSTHWDSYDFNCVVVRGHRNVAVLALQESLNACYLQGIAEDSDFGRDTERALKNAQARINHPSVKVDGRFGPNTSSHFMFQAYDHSNGGAHTGWCARR
jgi:hypothetical protein